MPDELARARLLRRRSDRAARRAAWVNAVSFNIELTWPRGALGMLFGVAMMCIPTGGYVMAAWIIKHWPRTLVAIMACSVVCTAISKLLQWLGEPLGLGLPFAMLPVVIIFALALRRRRAAAIGGDDAA